VNDLLVSECFGPTIQGEGPNAGRPATFVRLGLCNLDCSWCDTPYTWDWTGKNGAPQDKTALLHMTVDAVAKEITSRDTQLVVITGGEPMLQQNKIAELVDLLAGTHDFEIETNGTLAPTSSMPVRFNVSPKLSSSGVDAEQADKAMRNYAGRVGAIFKFVVAGYLDLLDVDRLVNEHGVGSHRVWLMPEGRLPVDLIGGNATWLAERCIERGFNFSQRLHVLLWGDERGR
jgi:7-carboxy-7-deazaguanine synthase